MINILITVGLFIFGAALGSFAAAQVWRLRVRQLAADSKHGEHIAKKDADQVKVLAEKKSNISTDRSVCLHCGRTLMWYDLIPVVSWTATRGKCRTCHKPIGMMEVLAEVGLGVIFALSYIAWPHGDDIRGVVLFVIWCLILVLLAIHWMYDAKWFLLLDAITLGMVGAALLFVAFLFTAIPVSLMGSALTNIGLTLLVLPGFYGLLYLVSRGQWVGLGDIKLLIPFALLLPSWEHGVLLIFLANLIGCIVLIPSLVTKKLTRMTRVPFGPFLIAAFVVTFLFGQRILDFYIGTILF